MKKKLTAAAVLLAMAVSFGAGFAAEARPAPPDEKKVERRQPPPDRKPAPRPAPAPGPRPAPGPAPRPEPRPAPAPRPGPSPRPEPRPAPGPRPAPAPRPAPPRPEPPPKPHHRSMHGSDYLKGILGILGGVAASSSSSESYDRYDSYEESASSSSYYSESYAEEVLALCNAERAKVGAPSLRLDPSLQITARNRAKEIVRNFSHTRPNGKNVTDDFAAPGSSMAENLAGGYASPQEVVAGWMADTVHRANILDPNYTMMGLGFCEDGSGMYRYYWAQLLRG